MAQIKFCSQSLVSLLLIPLQYMCAFSYFSPFYCFFYKVCVACIIKSKTYGTCISLKPPRTGQLQLVTFSLDYSSKHYSFTEPVILRFPDSCAEPIAITGFGFSLFIDSGSLDSLRIFAISS